MYRCVYRHDTVRGLFHTVTLRVCLPKILPPWGQSQLTVTEYIVLLGFWGAVISQQHTSHCWKTRLHFQYGCFFKIKRLKSVYLTENTAKLLNLVSKSAGEADSVLQRLQDVRLIYGMTERETKTGMDGWKKGAVQQERGGVRGGDRERGGERGGDRETGWLTNC